VDFDLVLDVLKALAALLAALLAAFKLVREAKRGG